MIIVACACLDGSAWGVTVMTTVLGCGAVGGGGVVGGVGYGAASRGLCGYDRKNPARTAAAAGAGKRPGKHGAGTGSGNGSERGHDGRIDAGLKARGSGNLKCEMAGDGERGGALPGGVGNAGSGEGDAGHERENGGRGVISVGVDGAAIVGTRAAGKAPTDGRIGLTAARDSGVERLERAEFNGSGNGKKRDGDVAGDSDAGSGGLGGIGVAGSGHLELPAGRKVCGGGEDSLWGDCPDLRGATRNAVDAP